MHILKSFALEETIATNWCLHTKVNKSENPSKMEKITFAKKQGGPRNVEGKVPMSTSLCALKITKFVPFLKLSFNRTTKPGYGRPNYLATLKKTIKRASTISMQLSMPGSHRDLHVLIMRMI